LRQLKMKAFAVMQRPFSYLKFENLISVVKPFAALYVPQTACHSLRRGIILITINACSANDIEASSHDDAFLYL
ncbi:hypothetical protein, partial [Shewanella saliphila]|uniref:hypothetical protein n=1 Tax=Shewanella saliphila TaxID=2282698 RepID=UPI001E2BD823